jgi:TonB-like protein
MSTRLTFAIALCGLAAPGLSQNKPVIVVKHIESMGYPAVARQARLQGSISIRLKISSAGSVVDAEASTADALLKEHPLLQNETVKHVRNWTFSCVDCAPKDHYEHTLTFIYRLVGEETQNEKSHFRLDPPDRVTITANPPQANW